MFISDRDGGYDIYLLSLREGPEPVKRLTYDGTNKHGPAWSPEGAQLVFAALVNEPANMDVFVINRDGTGLLNITNHPAFDGDPCWWPDGSEILFATNRDGANVNIYAIRPDGSEANWWTRGTGNSSVPACPLDPGPK